MSHVDEAGELKNEEPQLERKTGMGQEVVHNEEHVGSEPIGDHL